MEDDGVAYKRLHSIVANTLNEVGKAEDLECQRAKQVMCKYYAGRRIIFARGISLDSTGVHRSAEWRSHWK